MIPHTSPKRYLSASHGLNIPCPEGTDGDWHLLALFHPERSDFLLAGEGEGTIININKWLHDEAVHECSKTLNERGIKTSGKVYAASHARSLLEFVLYLGLQGHSTQWISEFLNPHDFLPERQILYLDKLIERCDSSVPGYHSLIAWRACFSSSVPSV